MLGKSLPKCMPPFEENSLYPAVAQAHIRTPKNTDNQRLCQICGSKFMRGRHEPSEFENVAGTMLLYPLHDPNGTGMWDENTGAVTADYGTVPQAGCALFKLPGVPWSSTGEGRYNTVLKTSEVVKCTHAPKVTNWLAFDVRRHVATIATNPAENLGWIFYTETDDTIRGKLYTADSPIAAKRPVLEVSYIDGVRVRA